MSVVQHSPKRVLITGSAGRIGTVLARGLAARGHSLRLFDRVHGEPIQIPGEENVERIAGDITDQDAIAAACDSIDVVIHLAGIPEEDAFEPILDSNIRGTYHVYESARLQRVPRVVFASTNHVIGFYPSDQAVDVLAPPRPDTLYAASKVYGEALGRLYHDKYGIEVVAVRIGSFRVEPGSLRELRTWLSHGDAVRLFQLCVEAPTLGYEVVYGVSANSQLIWSDRASEILGYVPEDSGDDYARPGLEGNVDDRFHGGSYTNPDHTGGF